MEDIYQEYIIELYKNPLNFGEIKDADHKAEVYNAACGDRIILFLKVKNKTIEEAKFTGQGCAISQASASLFTKYLKGKKLEDLSKIAKNDVLSLLKIDLSKNPTRMRCALLPLDALKKALKTTTL
ncbi:iron-sulfur cluster assembly scaffold protein [Candidatus Micrarchaeota archaeon]|nr:iron-sulfur cluster assembly scaffold protein [Candidatus Micrarchaeota archaeon]